jgi:hypothetical protein
LPEAEAPEEAWEDGKGERRSIGRENARDSSRGRKKRDRQRKAHQRDKGQDLTKPTPTTTNKEKEIKPSYTQRLLRSEAGCDEKASPKNVAR